jgi:hypothetical protein
MNQIQTRRSPLGIYYPDWGEWEPMQQTISYSRAECEEARLLWLNGICFRINEDNIVDIYYVEERRPTDGARLQHYYAVLHS